jgi:hypothetical protein
MLRMLLVPPARNAAQLCVVRRRAPILESDMRRAVIVKWRIVFEALC